ncbi:MAG: N-acetyltransferase [Bacteroidales bacterium]|jgi:ribosomal protein S18 acetylase RimI-like enzyme|nr:N-acetyltransferase [Bacteroidales bacterium]
MEGYRIRDYRPADYGEVARLWELTGMGNPERGDDRKTIAQCLELGGKLLILEDKDSGIIAGSSWMTWDGRRLYLHHFGILPEYQGRGLADYLLEETLNYVRSAGHQVKLEVHRTNKPAVSLYEKHGFTYLGDYLVYIIRDPGDIK